MDPLSYPAWAEPSPRSSWLCWQLPACPGQSSPDVAGIPGQGLCAWRAFPAASLLPESPPTASTATLPATLGRGSLGRHVSHFCHLQADQRS